MTMLYFLPSFESADSYDQNAAILVSTAYTFVIVAAYRRIVGLDLCLKASDMWPGYRCCPIRTHLAAE